MCIDAIRLSSIAGAFGAFLAAAPTVAAAQAAGPHLAIELNALDPAEGNCRISFVIENTHATDIESAVFEAVLFDAGGRVERLTLFDFGALPAGRPRVRQFVVPGLTCDNLGRVLINGAETCTGEGLAPGACMEGLDLKSRTGVELLG